MRSITHTQIAILFLSSSETARYTVLGHYESVSFDLKYATLPLFVIFRGRIFFCLTILFLLRASLLIDLLDAFPRK